MADLNPRRTVQKVSRRQQVSRKNGIDGRFLSKLARQLRKCEEMALKGEAGDREKWIALCEKYRKLIELARAPSSMPAARG